MLDASLLRYGEVDSSLDIPAGIARTDNVWSAAVIFTLGRALASMRWVSGPFSTVDVYLDPKSLTSEHQRAIRATLRNELQGVHREWCAHNGLAMGRKISVRRLEFVSKAKRDDALTRRDRDYRGRSHGS